MSGAARYGVRVVKRSERGEAVVTDLGHLARSDALCAVVWHSTHLSEAEFLPESYKRKGNQNGNNVLHHNRSSNKLGIFITRYLPKFLIFSLRVRTFITHDTFYAT
jgi:hypothetical protein